MTWRSSWASFRQRPAVQTGLFGLGVVLILVSPVFGALPGPGGVFVLAAGLALSLQNSRWAKRRYVHFKRWQPKAGSWTDWGLRRKSARRRVALQREREAQEAQDAQEALDAQQAQDAQAPLPAPDALATARPATLPAEDAKR